MALQCSQQQLASFVVSAFKPSRSSCQRWHWESISVPARGPIPPQQLLNFGAGPNTEGAGGELPLVESIQAMPANPAIVEVGACCTSVARMLAAASATHKSRRSEACRAGQGHV